MASAIIVSPPAMIPALTLDLEASLAMRFAGFFPQMLPPDRLTYVILMEVIVFRQTGLNKTFVHSLTTSTRDGHTTRTYQHVDTHDPTQAVIEVWWILPGQGFRVRTRRI